MNGIYEVLFALKIHCTTLGAVHNMNRVLGALLFVRFGRTRYFTESYHMRRYFLSSFFMCTSYVPSFELARSLHTSHHVRFVWLAPTFALSFNSSTSSTRTSGEFWTASDRSRATDSDQVFEVRSRRRTAAATENSSLDAHHDPEKDAAFAQIRADLIGRLDPVATPFGAKPLVCET